MIRKNPSGDLPLNACHDKRLNVCPYGLCDNAR
ncbi:Zinc/iron-chelating domain-containing protein [Pseudomonas sp. IT-P74]|uniref:Uncharacterized protein n=1 Tax=Pseudomonas fluorescens TaxID=294 RepID=A0A5E7S043_PSEFL|nr:hypothetical protein PS938_00492 [Pseudomonas fluorescens]